MLCFIHYLFIITTSAVDCPGRFVSGMSRYVSSGTLLTNFSDDQCDLYSATHRYINLVVVVRDAPIRHWPIIGQPIQINTKKLIL